MENNQFEDASPIYTIATLVFWGSGMNQPSLVVRKDFYNIL